MLVISVGISTAAVGVIVSVLVVVVLLVIVVRLVTLSRQSHYHTITPSPSCRSRLVSDKSLVRSDSDGGYYDCTGIESVMV